MKTLLSLFLLLFLSAASRVLAQFSGEISVEQNGSPILDGGTVTFGVVTLGSSSTKTLTIVNASPTQLLFALSLSRAGTNLADFSYTTLGTSSLAPGSSTTFDITFTPGGVGSRIAVIRVASSDSNENPFDINVNGTGSSPEIGVTQAGNTLTDGGSTVNFGSVGVGLTSSRTFTIRNTGNGNLTDLSLNVSGSAQFTSTSLTGTTIGGGGSMSFTVTFRPIAATQSSGLIRIYSSDANENPFDITITGRGIVPWLSVEHPAGNVLYDEFDTVDFGATGPGTVKPLEFTIRNIGTAPLTGLNVFVDGDNAGDFVPAALPATTLDVGGTLIFTVAFSPATTGARLAALHVSSNETFSNPFDIMLTGTASLDQTDEDNDGIVRLIEDASGTDPLVPNSETQWLTVGADFMEFVYQRRKSAVFEFSFVVEWADDPAASWTPADEGTAVIVSDDGTLQQVRYTIPVNPSGRRYVRLRVTRL